MAGFHFVDGRTRLATLHQAGCLKLRFPRTTDSMAEAILINSSGGLTGGDRLRQDFAAEDGASLSLTTQASERVYRASAGAAEIATTVRVGEGSSFHYLPQETILFDGGALARTLDIACAASSRLLVAESVVLGRTLMGETVRRGSLRDRWRIRRDGRLVFAEDLRFAGAVDDIAAAAASLGGAKAFCAVLCQSREAEAMLEAVRGLIGPAGGASYVGGFLVARLVADSGFLLRKRLIPVLSALANAPLPRVWST
jgi:urease accessory protein